MGGGVCTWAEQGMGTLMLQSGELPTEARIEFVLDVSKEHIL
jgi:hypothetical protein